MTIPKLAVCMTDQFASSWFYPYKMAKQMSSCGKVMVIDMSESCILTKELSRLYSKRIPPSMYEDLDLYSTIGYDFVRPIQVMNLDDLLFVGSTKKSTRGLKTFMNAAIHSLDDDASWLHDNAKKIRLVDRIIDKTASVNDVNIVIMFMDHITTIFGRLSMLLCTRYVIYAPPDTCGQTVANFVDMIKCVWGDEYDTIKNKVQADINNYPGCMDRGHHSLPDCKCTIWTPLKRSFKCQPP